MNKAAGASSGTMHKVAEDYRTGATQVAKTGEDAGVNAAVLPDAVNEGGQAAENQIIQNEKRKEPY